MSKRVLLLLVPTIAVASVLGFQARQDDDLFKLRKNFEIFGAVYEKLAAAYVDPLDAERLMRSGITAMLDNLDPYTVFIDEADRVDMVVYQQGRYADVGVELDFRNGELTVVAPVNGGSAFKQGVRTGDVIRRVGDRSVEGMTAQDVANMLRGEPGSLIEVVIVREGTDAPITFMLRREVSRPSPVVYSDFLFHDTETGVGYVKLVNFAPGADREVRTALSNLQETGHLKAVVLDLRDNLGGLLEAAVSIVGLFEPQGTTVVTTRGKAENSFREFKTKHAPLFPDLPVIVLVNELSASASEIVAGAMQDLDRGVLVGRSTFGKGLAQIVVELPYNTSLKITTSRYFTPSGRNLQAIDYRIHDGRFARVPDSLRRSFETSTGRSVFDGRGVDPDIVLSDPNTSDLLEALKQQAAFFYFANHYAASRPSIEESFEVSDDVYRAFRSWLRDQSFEFETSFERQLTDLVSELESAGYDRASRATHDVEELVDQHKLEEFDRYAEPIKRQLQDHIIARYFDGTKQLEIALGRDAAIDEALRLLSNRSRYQTILGRS